jgi:hypothetical protein
VYDTWLKGYRESPRMHSWPSEVYATYQRAVIDRLLKRSQLVVARPADWAEGIYGWACCEQQAGRFIVHFGSTKQPFRRNGVFWTLVDSLEPQGQRVFSHLRPPYTETLNKRGYTFDKNAAR